MDLYLWKDFYAHNTFPASYAKNNANLTHKHNS